MVMTGEGDGFGDGGDGAGGDGLGSSPGTHENAHSPDQILVNMSKVKWGERFPCKRAANVRSK